MLWGQTDGGGEKVTNINASGQVERHVSKK